MKAKGTGSQGCMHGCDHEGTGIPRKAEVSEKCRVSGTMKGDGIIGLDPG